MEQQTLFRQSVPQPAAVTHLRDRAMQAVGQKAEDTRPGFGEQAAAWILRYLLAHGRQSGESLTLHCKAVGIVPHDDRAFGPVYYGLAKRGLIRKVGTAVRLRGHRTAGGNIWEAV